MGCCYLFGVMAKASLVSDIKEVVSKGKQFRLEMYQKTNLLFQVDF